MIRKTPHKYTAEAGVETPSANTPDIATEVQTAPKPPQSGLIVKFVQSDTYRTMYANHSKIGVSQWDFTVIFGQAIESKYAENIILEEIAVRFSPQYFKTLVTSLSGAVAQWEAMFGKIETGPGQSFNERGMGAVFETMKGMLGELDKTHDPKSKS